MKSLFITLILLLSSSAFAQADDEKIFSLKTTRPDMSRVCGGCDPKLFTLDTIEFKYTFAGTQGLMEIIFDSTGQISSGWAIDPRDNFAEIHMAVMSRLTQLFGKPEPMAEQAIKSFRWISDRTEVTLTSIESLKILAITSLPYSEDSESEQSE